MISGQLFKLEFPLAHFATEGITADVLFPIIWEGIRLAESTGLKVIAVTADGVPIENSSQCMEIVTSIKQNILMLLMTDMCTLSPIHLISLKLHEIVCLTPMLEATADQCG